MAERPAVAGMVGGSIPLGDPKHDANASCVGNRKPELVPLKAGREAGSRGASEASEPVTDPPRRPRMSYRKRKLKRSKLGRLQFRLRLGWKLFFIQLKRKSRKEETVRFPATQKVMTLLRERSRLVRKNNLKINEWVDGFVDRCIANGQPVILLTQWCISKDLEVRYRRQNGQFTPTRRERLLFEKEIPDIAAAFSINGIRFDWWITFNRSYLDSGRIAPEVETAYKEMLAGLAKSLIEKGWLLLADWEDDILGRRPWPNADVLGGVERLIEPGALRVEIQRHSAWAREEAGLQQNDGELRQDVYVQIACEAEEGRILLGPKSPLGECILVPLEAPERYIFFSLLAKDFQKRIAAVLPPYPWRMKNAP